MPVWPPAWYSTAGASINGTTPRVNFVVNCPHTACHSFSLCLTLRWIPICACCRLLLASYCMHCPKYRRQRAPLLLWYVRVRLVFGLLTSWQGTCYVFVCCTRCLLLQTTIVNVVVIHSTTTPAPVEYNCLCVYKYVVDSKNRHTPTKQCAVSQSVTYLLCQIMLYVALSTIWGTVISFA